ncbi:hypothetical protein L1887_54883 [Cichorium endivia]|nr:hypothetical protein L1887_54883 [Cichorium endivia]
MEVGCVRDAKGVRPRTRGFGTAISVERPALDRTPPQRVKLCTHLRLWCFGLSEEWARRNSEARRLCLHNPQVPLSATVSHAAWGRSGEREGSEWGQPRGPVQFLERAVDVGDSRNPLCFLEHFVGGPHSTLASALCSSRPLILRGRALGPRTPASSFVSSVSQICVRIETVGTACITVKVGQ